LFEKWPEFFNKPTPPQGAGYSLDAFYRFYRHKRRGIQPIEIKIIFADQVCRSLKSEFIWYGQKTNQFGFDTFIGRTRFNPLFLSFFSSFANNAQLVPHQLCDFIVKDGRINSYLLDCKFDVLPQ
jgi:hypothetical protein